MHIDYSYQMPTKFISWIEHILLTRIPMLYLGDNVIHKT